MTKLSVNLNKVALVRNSRGGGTPSLLDAARLAVSIGHALISEALLAGLEGITAAYGRAIRQATE